jgi:alpha-galactosidase
MKKALIFLLGMLCVSPILSQKFEKAALTPPMGWNSWNKFACNVDENLIKEMAYGCERNERRWLRVYRH